MDNAIRYFARWLILALPIALALVFSTTLSASFSTPKNAVFIASSIMVAALALILPGAWRLARAERSFWLASMGYLCVVVVSAASSPLRRLSVESVGVTLCVALLVIAARMAWSGEESARDLRRLHASVSLAALLVALVTAAQFFGVNVGAPFGFPFNTHERMRMFATLGNPNFVASFLAMALPSAVTLAIADRRRRRWICSAPMVIGAAIVMTGSRGGILAMVVGMVVMTLCARRYRVVTIVVAIALCSVAVSSRLNERTTLESLRGRVYVWRVALGDGAAGGVLGGGPGTFASSYPLRQGRFFAQAGRESLIRFAGNERHAQNDFVEVWAEDGWLGLSMLLALLGAWFTIAARRLRQADTVERSDISAAIAAITSVCVAALFDFPLHRAETLALLALFLAAPMSPAIVSFSPQRRRWLYYSAATLLVIVGVVAASAPLRASYLLARGEAAENQGRWADAQRAYSAALRWDPTMSEALFNQVRVAAESGDYATALKLSDLALRYVNEPELRLLRARILWNAGRMDEARREVERGIRDFPYSHDLRAEGDSY